MKISIAGLFGLLLLLAGCNANPPIEAGAVVHVMLEPQAEASK